MSSIKSLAEPCAFLLRRAAPVLFLITLLSGGFTAYAEQKTAPAGAAVTAPKISSTVPVELTSKPGVSKFPSLPADMSVDQTVESQAFTKGALSYRLPAEHSGTFEASIDKLYLKKDELPANLAIAKVSKMKTNPQLSTTKSDFDKIAKEAFRSNISSTNWRVAHTSFYKGKDADDDTIYICIAVEYKRDISQRSFQKDIETLKNYLKKETADEYVLLEKFPFIIVIGSNQTGDYEYATVKKIASQLKLKLFGDIKIEPAAIVYAEAKPAAAEISGGDKTEEIKIDTAPALQPDTNKDTVSISIENKSENGSKAVSRTISEDKKAGEPKGSKKKAAEIISIEDITPDEQ